MLERIRAGLSEVIPGCIRIEPTALNVLQGIFNQVEIKPNDILVDIGCGDGDVIAYWLSLGLKNTIYGVELHGDTYDSTKDKFVDNVNVSIVHSDASKIIPEGTLYYLFNPFRGEQMERFARLVPKAARIVYYNPTELAMFDRPYQWIWMQHPKAVLMEAISA